MSKWMKTHLPRKSDHGSCKFADCKFGRLRLHQVGSRKQKLSDHVMDEKYTSSDAVASENSANTGKGKPEIGKKSDGVTTSDDSKATLRKKLIKSTFKETTNVGLPEVRVCYRRGLNMKTTSSDTGFSSSTITTPESGLCYRNSCSLNKGCCIKPSDPQKQMMCELKDADGICHDQNQITLSKGLDNTIFPVNTESNDLQTKSDYLHELSYAGLTDDHKLGLDMQKLSMNYYKTCYGVSLHSSSSVPDLLNNDTSSPRLLYGESIPEKHKASVSPSSSCIGIPTSYAAFETNLTFLYTSSPILESTAGNTTRDNTEISADSKIASRLNKLVCPSKSEASMHQNLLLNDSCVNSESNSSSNKVSLTFDWNCGSVLNAGTMGHTTANAYGISCKASFPENISTKLLSVCEKQQESKVSPEIGKGCSSQMQTVPSSSLAPDMCTNVESCEWKLFSKDDIFHEVDFEIFEDEDLRKQKAIFAGKYLQDHCQQSEPSIINIDKANISGFFVTDTIKLNCLNQMSNSVDDSNVATNSTRIGQESNLQKSWSSPDKFSDLSFALLPNIDVGMSTLKIEDCTSSRLGCLASLESSIVSEGQHKTSKSPIMFVEDFLRNDTSVLNLGLCFGHSKTSARRSEPELCTNDNHSNNSITKIANQDFPQQSRDVSLDLTPVCTQQFSLQNSSHSTETLSLSKSGVFSMFKSTDCTIAKATTADNRPQSATPGDGAIAVRPLSTTRRQLPVPLLSASGTLSSRISPPKSLLPTKSVGRKNSFDGIVTVQVEMEKQVKVQMVNQVNVGCTIQQSCESKPSASVLQLEESETTSSLQTQISVTLPLESSAQLSPHASKIRKLVPKSSIIHSEQPDVAQISFTPKDKADLVRSDAVSVPLVETEHRIRKGSTVRQLPGNDLIKKPRDMADRNSNKTASRGSPRVSEHHTIQLTPRLISSKNDRLTDDMKSMSKSGNRSSSVVPKVASENISNLQTKSSKNNVSVGVTSAMTVKRHMQSGQSFAGVLQKLGQEASSDSKKTMSAAELKSQSVEAKAINQKDNQETKCSARGLGKQPFSKLNPKASPRKLGTPRSSIPGMKLGGILLPAFGKDPSSSQKTSSASVSSSSRSEVTSQGTSSVQEGPTSEDKSSTKISFVKHKTLKNVSRTQKSSKGSQASSLSATSSKSSLHLADKDEKKDIGLLLLKQSKIPKVPQTSCDGGRPSVDQTSETGFSKRTMGLQYAHQPDVVSNSVLLSEHPIKKLHELETQYNEMKTQLNSLTVDLKARMAGFEAMATVVKYCAEQEDLISKKFSSLSEKLDLNYAKCEVLTSQRNALISEIQTLNEDHEVHVNGMMVTHQMELHAMQEKMMTSLAEVEEHHKQMISALKEENNIMADSLKSQYQVELEMKKEVFNQQLLDNESKHKQKIADLQRGNENQLKDLKVQFESVKMALVEKIDHVNSEYNELRHRYQIMIDGNASTQYDFGNCEAEKQVETLKQEVESLRVVVELRNQENSKLRNMHAMLEAQLEELAEAKQRILQLEQKLENTEAIVHMKSDYERELAEKHTSLLRRYNKESKDNKRLSMNNEELMWKLNQVAPSASPKAVRRTLSGPPTKSAPGTPLLSRRSESEINSESSQDDTTHSSNDSNQ